MIGNVEMKLRTKGLRQYLTQLAATIVIAVAAIVPGVAAPIELPPIVQPANGERHPGKMIWADLVTTDLAGAKRFYGALFGWSFRDIPGEERNFSLALLNGEPVGGLIQRAIQPGSPRQANWLTFISVPDVSEAQRIVLAHGGKVLSAPRTYPQRGRQAVFADPHGAPFAVLQSSSGDPIDVLADPGDWIWSSLLTPDPDKDAAFYQAVFGYEVFDLSNDDGLEHLLLANDDYARVSVNELPPRGAKGHPHWLNFIRVLSTTDAAAKVIALGGQILVAPHLDRHGGLIAVAADPAGAPFGLLEWPAATSKEVVK